MLAGNRPFDSVDGTPVALIMKHLLELPPPIPELSPELQKILFRALAKDPSQRYSKAGELAMALMQGVFGLARPSEQLPPQALLIENLRMLVEQATAYERALPSGNYPARAAVSTLGELGRKALAEAQAFSGSLVSSLPVEHPFSPRELEVLQLAALGLTNKEIAYRLGISERTVQFHMNSIFNKTCTESRTEAVALGLNKGWISLPPV
jgi:DNA-binding NarL/FixJ family response regulator